MSKMISRMERNNRQKKKIKQKKVKLDRYVNEAKEDRPEVLLVEIVRGLGILLLATLFVLWWKGII